MVLLEPPLPSRLSACRGVFEPVRAGAESRQPIRDPGSFLARPNRPVTSASGKIASDISSTSGSRPSPTRSNGESRQGTSCQTRFVLFDEDEQYISSLQSA